MRELKTNPIGPESIGADAVADVRAALTTLTRRAAAFESNVEELEARRREVEAQIDAVLAGSPANSPVHAAPAADAFNVGAAVTAPWQGKTALFPGTVVAWDRALNTVDVQFNDGDFERAIPKARVLLLHQPSASGGAGEGRRAASSTIALMDLLEKATPGSALARYVEQRRTVRSKIAAAKEARGSTVEEHAAAEKVLHVVRLAAQIQAATLAFSKESIVQHDESVVKNVQAATAQMTTCIGQIAAEESKRQAKVRRGVISLALSLSRALALSLSPLASTSVVSSSPSSCPPPVSAVRSRCAHAGRRHREPRKVLRRRRRREGDARAAEGPGGRCAGEVEDASR